jgi:hypothetical protein
MSPLVERDEFGALVSKSPLGYCSEVAWLWLFFELRYHGSRGAILHGSWKLAQTVDGFFKQFRHSDIITYDANTARRFRVRKSDIVRSAEYRSVEPFAATCRSMQRLFLAVKQRAS